MGHDLEDEAMPKTMWWREVGEEIVGRMVKGRGEEKGLGENRKRRMK